MFHSLAQPKGYLENIVRLRKANEEKKKMNEIRASQGVSKNYTGEITKPKPFNLKTQSITKKEAPAMLIEVNVGPGKTGVIGVHPEDNPKQLAANFCKIYHLDEVAEEGLYNIIRENMEDTSPDNDDIDAIEEVDEPISNYQNSRKISIGNIASKSKNDSYDQMIEKNQIITKQPQLIQETEEGEGFIKGNESELYEMTGNESQQMVDGEDINYR